MSKNQWRFQVGNRLGSEMFDDGVGFQKIKPQGIFFGIHFAQQSVPQQRPVFLIHAAFKNRVLHSLAIIQTSTCDAAQSSCTCFADRSYVVSNQHQHRKLFDRIDKISQEKNLCLGEYICLSRPSFYFTWLRAIQRGTKGRYSARSPRKCLARMRA